MKLNILRIDSCTKGWYMDLIVILKMKLLFLFCLEVKTLFYGLELIALFGCAEFIAHRQKRQKVRSRSDRLCLGIKKYILGIDLCTIFLAFVRMSVQV